MTGLTEYVGNLTYGCCSCGVDFEITRVRLPGGDKVRVFTTRIKLAIGVLVPIEQLCIDDGLVLRSSLEVTNLVEIHPAFHTSPTCSAVRRRIVEWLTAEFLFWYRLRLRARLASVSYTHLTLPTKRIV